MMNEHCSLAHLFGIIISNFLLIFCEVMHQQWLLKALSLASAHKGFCAPNPAVGAVVVKNGELLSAGAHSKAGQSHAEYIALTKLKYPIEDATLYISLEPCSHWGKTPPCVDEIIRSGIKQVVFGFADPNPVIEKFDTIGHLAKHGIDCLQVEMPEITAFYQSYAYLHKHNKPYLRYKIAQTLNGKIARVNGGPTAISNQALKVLTHQYRKQADGILTTAKTVIADNPLLTVRLPGEAVISKPIAILDRTCRLTGQERIFDNQQAVIIFHDWAYQPPVNVAAEYVAIDVSQDKLVLEAVLQALAAKGWADVWVEAGGQLFSEMLTRGCINQLLLYIAPHWLAKEGEDGYCLSHDFSRAKAKSMHWQSYDGDMLLTMEF